MAGVAGFVRRWRALLSGLLVFGVAVAIHGVLHALQPPVSRPVPSLAAVPWVIAGAGVAAVLVSTVSAIRRTEGGLAKVGAGALHGLVVLAGLAAVVASDPAFPFGPIHQESLVLPGERGTAYLYRGGLFCSQTVRRAAVGQWWSQPDPEARSYACEPHGRLWWDAEQQRVLVVDLDGEPLRGPEAFGNLAEGFDWRPH